MLESVRRRDAYHCGRLHLYAHMPRWHLHRCRLPDRNPQKLKSVKIAYAEANSEDAPSNLIDWQCIRLLKRLRSMTTAEALICAGAASSSVFESRIVAPFPLHLSEFTVDSSRPRSVSQKNKTFCTHGLSTRALFLTPPAPEWRVLSHKPLPGCCQRGARLLPDCLKVSPIPRQFPASELAQKVPRHKRNAGKHAGICETHAKAQFGVSPRGPGGHSRRAPTRVCAVCWTSGRPLGGRALFQFRTQIRGAVRSPCARSAASATFDGHH